jgi:hypothetical protein
MLNLYATCFSLYSQAKPAMPLMLTKSGKESFAQCRKAFNIRILFVRTLIITTTKTLFAA